MHYTGRTGPARTQRCFAAKKVRAGPCGSGRVRVRVRVVEFSFKRITTVQCPSTGPFVRLSVCARETKCSSAINRAAAGNVLRRLNNYDIMRGPRKFSPTVKEVQHNTVFVFHLLQISVNEAVRNLGVFQCFVLVQCVCSFTYLLGQL